MTWHRFGDGASVGHRGSELGIIVEDEEHLEGARITLEEDGQIAPWSITCGIYGLMVHTPFFANRPVAEAEFEAMKSAIDVIMSQLDPADLAGQARLAGDFVERFP